MSGFGRRVPGSWHCPCPWDEPPLTLSFSPGCSPLQLRGCAPGLLSAPCGTPRDGKRALEAAGAGRALGWVGTAPTCLSLSLQERGDQDEIRREDFLSVRKSEGGECSPFPRTSRAQRAPPCSGTVAAASPRPCRAGTWAQQLQLCDSAGLTSLLLPVPGGGHWTQSPLSPRPQPIPKVLLHCHPPSKSATTPLAGVGSHRSHQQEYFQPLCSCSQRLGVVGTSAHPSCQVLRQADACIPNGSRAGSVRASAPLQLCLLRSLSAG